MKCENDYRRGYLSELPHFKYFLFEVCEECDFEICILVQIIGGIRDYERCALQRYH